MKEYNEKKVCFIICTNDERQLQECLLYIDLLEIPTGYETEILAVSEAESMTKGYNEAMNASDAKYKVYLHQDVFITERNFIQKMIHVFKKDSQIGMMGMIGSPRLPKDGIMWHGKRCGDFYRLDEVADEEQEIEKIKKGIREVEAVDGYLMITQYDIPWREDIFTGWDFYDISQCLEFRRAGFKVVVPAQNPAWAIHDCGPQKLWNYEKERKKLLSEYKEFFENKKEWRVLFFHSTKIQLSGLVMGLMELGHDVKISEYQVTLDNYVKQDEEIVTAMLEEGHYDLVVTYDFSEGVSEACERSAVKYLAWVYDSPLVQLYRDAAANEFTYISVFDEKQRERLSELGIKHLHYYPLAAEVDTFGMVTIKKADEKKYSSEVSFVGNLYTWGAYERAFTEASAELKKDAERIINSTDCVWDGKNNVFGLASEEIVQYLSGLEKDSFWEDYKIDKRYFCESLILGIKASELERIAVLNKVAEKHEMVLYTGSNEVDTLKNVKVRPKVDYLQVMPKVFHLSKINLNITVRTIETGISQRIWDVMSVGGFLLTNYQPELEKYFEIGKDIEVFHDLDELMEKIDYYLKHEEERIRIAMNGYKKVRAYHKYSNRLEQILKEVFAYSGK